MIFFISFSTAQRVIYSNFHQVGHDLALYNAKYNLTIQVVSIAYIAVTFMISGKLVLSDLLSLGSMIAITQLAGLVTGALSSLTKIMVELEDANIAFDRMYEFASLKYKQLDQDGTSNESFTNGLNTLKLENIGFRFFGSKLLLKNISFEVSRGECISIVGDSGSGKSTLLRILQKFYDYEGGKIIADNIELKDISNSEWRNLLGVLPQEVHLFNGNIIENIVMGSKIDDPQDMIYFLNSYGFAKYFEAFPNGFATMLGESGIRISEGQKKLVGLARALYHKPSLLLLDEPTASLDRDIESFVISLIQSIKKNMGVICLTHNIVLAQKSDRMYLIENETLTEPGGHLDFIKTNNLYSRMWDDIVNIEHSMSS